MEKIRAKEKGQGKINITDTAGHTTSQTNLSDKLNETSKTLKQQHEAAWTITIDIGQTTVAESQKGMADGENTGETQSPQVTVPNTRVDIGKRSKRERRSRSKDPEKEEQSYMKAAKHKEINN